MIGSQLNSCTECSNYVLGDCTAMIDESFLRELFFQRLPPNVRMVLTSTPDTTVLTQLADPADKIMEVGTVSTHPSLATQIEQLRGEMSRLEKLVKKTLSFTIIISPYHPIILSLTDTTRPT